MPVTGLAAVVRDRENPNCHRRFEIDHVVRELAYGHAASRYIGGKVRDTGAGVGPPCNLVEGRVDCLKEFEPKASAPAVVPERRFLEFGD